MHPEHFGFSSALLFLDLLVFQLSGDPFPVERSGFLGFLLLGAQEGGQPKTG